MTFFEQLWKSLEAWMKLAMAFILLVLVVPSGLNFSWWVWLLLYGASLVTVEKLMNSGEATFKELTSVKPKKGQRND